MFPHRAAEVERKPPVRWLAYEQGVAAEIAAELDLGASAAMLLVSESQLTHSDLLDSIFGRLARDSVRFIRIDGSGGAPVDVPRFCHLLVDASLAGEIVRDPAEHLANILTAPRAGERSLTLIVEDADALSTDALAFVARLAAASSAKPLRIQVLLLGSYALQVRLTEMGRLSGVGPVAVKRLDGPPAPSLKPLPMRKRTRRLRLALAAVGCLAGIAVYGTVRSGDGGRISPNPDSTVGTLVSTLPLPTAIEGQSVPRRSEALSSSPPQVQSSALVPPAGAALLPVDAVRGAGNADTGHSPEPQTTMARPPTEPLPQPKSAEASLEEARTRPAELLAGTDALRAGSAAEIDALLATQKDAWSAESPAKIDALPARRPTAGATRPGTESSASPATLLEPPPGPVPPAEPSSSTAMTDADAPLAIGPSAVALGRAEPLPAPAPPRATAAPSTPAAASAVQSATKPQRPLSGASPVAALLARGDALIAIGDVAAARLVYQRAATLSSARAATAVGKTYDHRFLQEVGAIGVVVDPEAAVAWYRKGAALGDEDAAPLLSGLDVAASQ